jgi:hypothetical protein
MLQIASNGTCRAETERVGHRSMSMKLVKFALVVVLISSSCDRPVPAAPRPSLSASPVAATPTSPSPRPTPTYLSRPVTVVTPESPLPTGPLGFSCKLPIYRLDSSTPPQSQVGFLSLPDGGVTLQPAPTLPAGSVITIDSTGPKPLYPSAFYFDRAVSTWLPVARGSVSPDGSHYAYMSFPALDQGVMNVVDVATGAVRSYPATYAEFNYARYVVMDYANEGMYLGLAYEGLGGVWLMDQNSGAIREAGPYYFYPLMDVAGSAVWFGSANPADPNPAPGGLAGVPDSVDSFNFMTGTQTPWVYLPGTSLQVVAVDAAGHPIVLVGHGSSDTAELLLLTRPGAAQQIFHGTLAELESITVSISPGGGGPIADSHGIWFGGPAGIYLYSPGVGMRKVFDQPGYPGNGCA